MQLKIQSTLSSPLGGVFEIDVSPTSTVQQLINILCSRRDVAPSNELCLCTLANQPLPPNSTLTSQGIENDDILYLAHINEVDSSSKMVKWLYVGIFAALIGIAGILATVVLYSLKSSSIPCDYGIVLDAGSSHTDIAVYHWLGKDNGTGVVYQSTTCTIKGGLSSSTDYVNAGKALVPCMKNISLNIPESSKARTPLYLGATAGMRLLNITNSLASDLILLSAKFYLSQSPFLVKSVKIISGEEEGVSGWITANFLSNISYSKTGYTYGALDMGGASTQISFVNHKDQDFNLLHVSNITLFGHSYPVYSQSYLCFGSNEAYNRYHAFLVYNSSNPEEPIIDPCLPKDHSFSRLTKDLFSHPCTECGIWKNIITTKNNYTFEGSSNSTECKKILYHVFDYETCQNEFNCSYCFEPLTNVSTNQPFVAFSTYAFAHEVLNVTDDSLVSYEDSSSILCHKSWDEIKNVPTKFRGIYCFDVWYMHNVLVNKYGFNNHTWPNLQFKNQMSEVDLGWALGYMIQATNTIPPEETIYTSLISFDLFVALVTISVIITILSLLSCYIWKSNRNQSTYNSL